MKMTVRYFALRTSESGKEKSVFTGRQPRQAALKAASRNYTSIYLRERGTSKLHFYKGVRRKVRAPVDRPSWMAAVVWKPNVRKMKIIHLKKPKKAKKAKRRKAKRRTTRRKVKRKAKRRKAPKRKAKRRVKRKAPKRKAKKRTTKRKTTKRRTTKRKTTKRKTRRRR
jgi:hypothetical protein